MNFWQLHARGKTTEGLVDRTGSGLARYNLKLLSNLGVAYSPIAG